jgi:hypothetical protein
MISKGLERIHIDETHLMLWCQRVERPAEAVQIHQTLPVPVAAVVWRLRILCHRPIEFSRLNFKERLTQAHDGRPTGPIQDTQSPLPPKPGVCCWGCPKADGCCCCCGCPKGVACCPNPPPPPNIFFSDFAKLQGGLMGMGNKTFGKKSLTSDVASMSSLLLSIQEMSSSP